MLKIIYQVSYTFTVPLVFLLSVSSCTNQPQKTDIEELFISQPDLESKVKYAQGFDLFTFDGITKVVIYHPELSRVVIKTLYLIDKQRSENYKKSNSVFISPLDSVAIFSATQINAFDKLGILEKIIGVSEASYINNQHVKHKYQEGLITELAGSGDFFVETTMMVNPSVIFYSPLKFIESHPLDVTGIPLIPFYDYMETDPLGRAEWLKFTAVFFNQYAKADSLFQEIEREYIKYRRIAKEAGIKPTIFSDKYFNGQWYVPGGESYIAQLFDDAGADYIWKDDPHQSSFPLDYEVVYHEAHDADFWRIVGSFGEEASYKALAQQNGLYKHFKAFQKKRVIWCDAQNTAYFETSPLEPHIVLADLIKALHPELLTGYEPKYYYVLP